MMKRYGNLYPQIIDYSNLLLAANKAQKGKRWQQNVLRFNYKREQELERLRHQLSNFTYQPGSYTTFEIYEPKRRMISAAPYRDRIVHHALCNVIAPIFERTFIADSYANREGYGTHKALRKFINFARSSRYVLQCDIKKYFPSMDHEILKQLIRRKIKCQETLWLIDKIIDNSNEQIPVVNYFPGDDLLSPVQRRKGLPIGNLTSQLSGNIYLSGLDHFVKETLKCQKYVRYVDDFALFSDEQNYLQEARQLIEEYLVKLRLKIHPVKSQLFETKRGANFLGFRILPNKIRVKSANLKLARKRLKKLQLDYANGGKELKDIIQSIQAWEAHLKHGNTWRLRQQIFTTLVFTRE